jgi:hypothetical protein
VEALPYGFVARYPGCVSLGVLAPETGIQTLEFP